MSRKYIERLDAGIPQYVVGQKKPDGTIFTGSAGWRRHLRAERRLANIATANAEMDRVNAPFIAAHEEEARRAEQRRRSGWGY